MDDASTVAVDSKARRQAAVALSGLMVIIAAGLVVLALFLHAMSAGGRACSRIDQMPLTRQAPPTLPQQATTYCPPNGLAVHAAHPDLPAGCGALRLADVPAWTVAPGDAWSEPVGALISPDDRTLTVVWTGVPGDHAVVIEEANDVRIGVVRTAPLEAVGRLFGAALRLGQPLRSRTVRLVEPRTNCSS